MSKRERVFDVLTLVVLLLALALGAESVFSRVRSDPPRSPRPVATQVDDWRDLSSRGHALGPSDAPVTVLVFSDFQCPYCRMFDETADSLLDRYPQQLRFVFRHAPGVSHLHARTAAVASECAAAQRRFHEMRRALFKDQRSIGVRPWEDFALHAGVTDTARFVSCMRSSVDGDKVGEDLRAASQLRIAGTPTVLVNGLRFTGNLPLPIADSIVRALLRSDGV